MNLVFVALGGAAGASLRYLAGRAALQLVESPFPWGTLLVNISGCFLMGLVYAWLQPRAGSGLFLFLGTGVLGGFTTFSAFSLETVLLWQRGGEMLAAAYVTGSVALSLGALVAGMLLVRGFSG